MKPIEDMGHVAPGKILMEIQLESEMLSSLLIRPDGSRRYLPVVRILQVGDGVPEDCFPGRWAYISQYAGQVISQEGIDEGSKRSRLICSYSDILHFYQDCREAHNLCEALFEA